MTALIVFLLTLAATLRLTRLAIHDGITQPFRDRLEDWASRKATRSRTMLVKLFECPWCLGAWLSAATAAAELHAANPVPTISLVWTYPALVLTLSWLVGLFDMLVYSLEIWEPPGSPGRH